MGPSPTDAALAGRSRAADRGAASSRSGRTTASSARASTPSGELIARSEADLLDIRNFGAKSIDEVKAKLVTIGLALKDSPPGFDPTAVVDSYGAEGYAADDDDQSLRRDEQY